MSTTQDVTLEVWDIVSIVVYFVVVIAVGLFYSVRADKTTAKGYFLAERAMTFLPIAASIFATNVGASMFVGMAGTAAATGFAPIMFEWHGAYMLVLLGWIFVPIYIASASFTMPEYLRKRFGGRRLRVYYAIIQLVLIILIGISAEMYAGYLFIELILGWNLYASVSVILLITAVYTIVGGLTAVIYTDAIQTVILVLGSLVLSVISMNKIGGYDALVNQFQAAGSFNTYIQNAEYDNLTCGFPPEDSFHIFRDVQSDYPWPGIVFGLTILATYFFCTNQTIVQRNLSAKDVSHSKAACVVAGYLKILPFFLFVLPGMVSRVLFPEEIGCSDPASCDSICSDPAGCTNIAYPLLVLRVMPVGIRGLMLAAMLAALMSSLTSNYNSAATIFTMDLWREIRPKASEFENVLVGRVWGLLMVCVSIAWLPVLKAIQGGSLFDYIQSITSYLTPAWVVVFVLGMFWRRCTEQGAWWGLMAGLVTGIARMGVHFGYPQTFCGGTELDQHPPIYSKVHYLLFAIILALVTLIVTVSVSLITAPRPERKLRKVTWWTRRDKIEPELTSSEESEDDVHVDPPETELDASKSCSSKAYGLFCGVASPKMTKEDMKTAKEAMSNITEDPYWSRVCDINAFIIVALTCFLIGFYA